MNVLPRSPAFHRFSLVTLAVGTLLVWLGASVTTTGSGMAFADWPLSNGSINPPGWLIFINQFFEHAHRLAALTVGFLVLGMFFWQWRRARFGWILPIALVLDFVVVVSVVHIADNAAKMEINGVKEADMDVGARTLGSSGLWVISLTAGIPVLIWLVRGLCSNRWPLLLKLSAVALVTVVLQATLGGLRVLEVSDPFGVAHGCLGQMFYCVLIAIALVSSAWWERSETLVPARDHGPLVKLATALFVVVSLQLFFGAIIRHTQRGGLVATDIITTAGQMIPPFQPFTAFSIFMHKCWALVVFSLSWAMAWHARRILRGQGWVAILPKLLAVLPVIQVTLGVYVLLTSRKFWVTNFHVLNGLCILGTAFVLMIVTRRSRPMSGLIAGSEGTKSGQNASSPLQAGV